MFTDKAAAIVAVVFAAVILTHPGPGFASSHMGVLPSPGAGKGIIAQEKPAEFKPGAQTAAPGAKVGANPPDDQKVGAQPPDDTLPGTTAKVGQAPPDDSLPAPGAKVGVQPPDDTKGAAPPD
ncbi:MAG: hypothetical protein O7A64_05690, partial [Alphaproteobacteria bacterium]|nr:hypothetical protein [Alphaproteobacteria bacterium]